MRFISQHPGFFVQVRPQRVLPLGDGTRQVLVEPIYVRFTAVDAGGMIYEKERLRAESHFDFRGTQQHQDQATPVDLIHRLSVLDTVADANHNGWSEEDVAEIEAKLTELSQVNPNRVLRMEEAPLTPPFPAYDEWTGDPEKLVFKLVEDGFDLAEVLYYEQSDFGPRRADVIEALETGVEAMREFQVNA